MRRKRIFALLMVICIVACVTALMTACGSRNKPAEGEDQAAATEQTDTAQEGEQAQETAEGEEATSEFPKTMYVSAEDGLLLRKAPGQQNEVIYPLSYGQEIQVDKIEDGWANTTVDGHTGWCSMDYLTENGSEIKGKESSSSSKIDPNELVKPKSKDGSGFHGVVDSPEGLNMRYGPGPEYNVIEIIPDKTELTELGWENGWVYIMWKGKYGWISAQYFRMENE